MSFDGYAIADKLDKLEENEALQQELHETRASLGNFQKENELLYRRVDELETEVENLKAERDKFRSEMLDAKSELVDVKTALMARGDNA